MHHLHHGLPVGLFSRRIARGQQPDDRRNESRHAPQRQGPGPAHRLGQSRRRRRRDGRPAHDARGVEGHHRAEPCREGALDHDRRQGLDQRHADAHDRRAGDQARRIPEHGPRQTGPADQQRAQQDAPSLAQPPTQGPDRKGAQADHQHRQGRQQAGGGGLHPRRALDQVQQRADDSHGRPQVQRQGEDGGQQQQRRAARRLGFGPCGHDRRLH